MLYVEDNPDTSFFMKDLLSSFENIELMTPPTAEMGNRDCARAVIPT